MKVLLFFSLIFCACSTDIRNSSETANDLLNSSWKLIEMHGDDISNSDNSPTLIFTSDTNKIAGSSGCNSYGGEIELLNEDIRFKNIISTKMFCKGRMETEKKYFSALEEIDKIKLMNERLHLVSKDKSVLVFEKNN